MRQSVSTKFIYPLTIFLITFETMQSVFYWVVNTIAWGSIYKMLQIPLVISVFTLDTIIDSALLYLYVKSLHEYAIEQYFKIDIARNNLNGITKLLDDRQHELMLEAARYTVLYSMIVVVNFVIIILAVIGCIIYKSLPDSEQIAFLSLGFTAIFVCISIKESFLLMAIQLSFIFSHSTYEKICKKCDNWVKNCCQEMVRRKNENILRAHDLQQPLL